MLVRVSPLLPHLQSNYCCLVWPALSWHYLSFFFYIEVAHHVLPLLVDLEMKPWLVLLVMLSKDAFNLFYQTHTRNLKSTLRQVFRVTPTFSNFLYNSSAYVWGIRRRHRTLFWEHCQLPYHLSLWQQQTGHDDWLALSCITVLPPWLGSKCSGKHDVLLSHSFTRTYR